jgi:hypothetical protein
MKSLFDKLGLADDNAGVFDGEWRQRQGEDPQDFID